MKTKNNILLSMLLAVALFFSAKHTILAQAGISWNNRTPASTNSWYGITYGNGKFVAVAWSGTGNRVMTSPDGIAWTSRASASDNDWNSVTYGNGLFVAVASSGTGNRVMTSPDGITWTSRNSAADIEWYGVTYGNGLFVAVSNTGSGNRVMTSPDGINWEIRTSASDSQWVQVTYGNGLFVAIAIGGPNRIMTSPDGITWTLRTPPSNNSWYGVTYGNGLFVAVANSGTDRVMTSPDGITWTARSAANNNDWGSVTYGSGLFVAVAGGVGTANRVMTSPDGVTWTIRTSATDNHWINVTYAGGLFVAISDNNATNGVMTSGTFVLPVHLSSFSVSGSNGMHQLLWQTADETNNRQFNIERSSNAKVFETIGTIDGAGNSSTTKTYRYTDTKPLAGTNYYRLKQIDLSGEFEYSRIIQIKNDALPVFTFAPNPVREQATISITTYQAQTVQYSVTDNSGRLLQQKSIAITPGTNVLPISTTQLSNGVYIVDVKGDGIREQTKIVKN